MPPMLPSPLLTLPPTGLILSAAYHPYTPEAHSRCDSNSTPHLFPHHFLCFCTPALSSLLLNILTLLQRPRDMPQMLLPHLHDHPSLHLHSATLSSLPLTILTLLY
ncbi:hypothetical protein O181_032055 [Austropuccinia psidii MF-1]|uniref:Uncharacterized protein n=1 Tax=Austropuccinia psidii MF-1 TaxID=1389203 RepID=A0A9Q3H7V1_9BASI|nr:hypothetical protein [Austropuccinia psidii MF-1]